MFNCLSGLKNKIALLQAALGVREVGVKMQSFCN